MLVAYFSMEFGLEGRLPIYSGGLGVLAGDHLKAAAELGVPLVGVGLFYRGGYFTQGVSPEGRQTESYTTLDPEALGLVREPVDVQVELAGIPVTAAVWRHDVGSVPLYLLDVEWLTDALYGGDREHRIRQELLLGVGGVRALAALGIEPTVFHVNEGHSAFLTIERARTLVETGVVDRTTRSTRCGARPSSRRTRRSRPATRSSARSSSSVTSETWRRAPASRASSLLGARPLGRRRRLRADAARAAPLRARERRLASSTARSRARCGKSCGPGQPTPIDAITNGVHLGTWLAPELAELVRGRRRPAEAPADSANWPAARTVDREALWDDARRR